MKFSRQELMALIQAASDRRDQLRKERDWKSQPGWAEKALNSAILKAHDALRDLNRA